MKKSISVALFVVPALLSALTGCRGKAQELAEEQIAEAIINQAFSAYSSFSATASINGKTISMDCSSGGTLEWSQTDGSTGTCYKTDTNGCTMSGNYGSITLEGVYTMCVPSDVDPSNGVESLVGKTVSIEGTVQASAENFESKECNYSLTLSNIATAGSGNGLSLSSDISGTTCRGNQIDLSTSFSVEGSVSVE